MRTDGHCSGLILACLMLVATENAAVSVPHQKAPRIFFYFIALRPLASPITASKSAQIFELENWNALKKSQWQLNVRLA